MITPLQFALELKGRQAAGVKNAASIVDRHGQMLLADVKRRAARPRVLPSVPGMPPRLQTGNYNRSIGIKFSGTTERRADIGTNAVQGARLEFGFQAPGQFTHPHPHFRPALKWIEPIFAKALQEAVWTRGD